MTKYKCVNACIWLGQYWKKGAIYEGDKTPPYHFVSLEPPANPAKPAKTKSVKTETETETKAGE